MKTNFFQKFKKLTKIKSVKKADFFSKERIIKKIKKALEVGAIFFIAILLILIIIIVYQKNHYDKFYSGLRIANINLSGKTLPQARKLINTQIETLINQGINIKYQNQYINLAAIPITTTPDTSFDMFSFDTDQSLQKLFNIGRSDHRLKDLKDQFLTLIFLPNEKIEFFLDEEMVKEILQENLHHFEQPARDAQIEINNNEVNITAEKFGHIFDYNQIIEQIKFRLAYLNTEEIKINIQPDEPKIYQSQAEKIKNQAIQIINLAPIILKSPENFETKNNKWKISKDKLANIITAKKKSYGLLKQAKIFAGLNNEKIKNLLITDVIPDINIEPVDAKFNMKNGKVVEFKTSKNGQKLNINQTIAKIENALLEKITSGEKTESPTEITLVIEEVESSLNNKNINNLGINELLGTGYSSFAGSPYNRRHNISIGAWSVHGTLIKPGDEFSLIKTLGKIDDTNGYLPELVIKENKTIAEYGGGLCQVGTTVFRATFNSGLPVTERRNHSYRVSYYEPAGTDATIYDPLPDYKFLNDTNHYVLIQTRISGNNLYFDFWGTKDGRTSFFTKPKIYNITTPPPTKVIETDELKPGEKKCTEHAHNGADASFYYEIEYPDGEKKETTFTSHYRPWQEVCLIGKATTTLEVINEEVIEKIFTE